MCHEAGQSAFLHTQLYLSTKLDHILYLATFLGTNGLSVLMCRKAVNQSIKLNITTKPTYRPTTTINSNAGIGLQNIFATGAAYQVGLLIKF